MAGCGWSVGVENSRAKRALVTWPKPETVPTAPQRPGPSAAQGTGPCCLALLPPSATTSSWQLPPDEASKKRVDGRVEGSGGHPRGGTKPRGAGNTKLTRLRGWCRPPSAPAEPLKSGDVPICHRKWGALEPRGPQRLTRQARRKGYALHRGSVESKRASKQAEPKQASKQGMLHRKEASKQGMLHSRFHAPFSGVHDPPAVRPTPGNWQPALCRPERDRAR